MSFASDIGRMVSRGPQRQLTEQETMTLLQLTMMCEEPQDTQIEFYRTVCKQSQALAILDHRIGWVFGEEVLLSPPAIIWLSTLCDRPGNVVLMVAVLAHLKAEGREFSLNSLIGSYFSEGIPTRECYQLAWNAQKKTEDRAKSLSLPVNGTDNILDYKEAWYD
jgi:hypothetical protein